MNKNYRFFFDQCLSKKLAHKVVEVFREDYPDVITLHLSERFAQNEPDEKWIPELSNDPEWVVITADKGLDPKREKLPMLCREFNISHVSMTQAVHHAGYSVHKHALLSLWPQ